MKEIKFRAWIIKAKKMIDVNIIDLRDKSIESVETITGEKYEGDLTFKVMQYIGRKDRNGIEIYVGDIVDGACGKHIIKWGEDVGVGFGFVWESIESDFTESITGYIDEYEIIGNEFENPELLEEREQRWKKEN